MHQWKKAATHYRALTQSQNVLIERQKALLIYVFTQILSGGQAIPEINAKGGKA